MMKIAGSGSINLRHGSADPDPDLDPPQNVIDPQHCIIQMHPLWYSTILYFSASHGTRFCLPFLVRSGQILQIQINGLNLKV